MLFIRTGLIAALGLVAGRASVTGHAAIASAVVTLIMLVIFVGAISPRWPLR